MRTGRTIVEAWLAERLSEIACNDEPVVSWRHPAPREAEYPHITVAILAPVDNRHFPTGSTTHETITAIVRAWDKGHDATRVNDIAASIQLALNGVHSQIVGDGLIVGSRRVGNVAITQLVEENETFQADGGQYKVQVVSYKN